MAEYNPPYVLQAAGQLHTAKLFRRALQGIVEEGVTEFNGDDDLKVVENSPTGMSVRVGRGGAYVLGDDTTDQGVYHVYNDGYKTLSIAAADGTNPRKDIVIFRVKDNTEGVAGDTSELSVVTGTPAGSPAEPALPTSAIKLAVVNVAAGATSIVNANITDSRNKPQIGTVNTVLSADQTSNLVHGAGTWQDIPGCSVTLNRSGIWVVSAYGLLTKTSAPSGTQSGLAITIDSVQDFWWAHCNMTDITAITIGREWSVTSPDTSTVVKVQGGHASGVTSSETRLIATYMGQA